MFVKDVVVQNQVGLHARPATFFIQKANEFKSSIWVEKEERRVNAKSLLGILSLGIVGGTTIRIHPVVKPNGSPSFFPGNYFYDKQLLHLLFLRFYLGCILCFLFSRFRFFCDRFRCFYALCLSLVFLCFLRLFRSVHI